MRPKFDRYLSVARRAEFLADLATFSDVVTIQGRSMGCRDPDDDRILETAVAGGAQALVTGDQDLLVMGEVEGVAILTPGDFLSRVGG